MGEGLERSKGVMVVKPTTFEDIRNMFLFDGKAQVRSGLLAKGVLQDDQPVDLDVTVMLSPLRSEAASIGVGYNTTGGTNREIWINRMAIDGTAPFSVGLYGVLPTDASFDPPIIIGADSDRRFFFAHDEPKALSRLVTKVYDPDEFPNLAPLLADLDGEGQNEVFFRGVVRHLSYIFGWGFGSSLDPVRDDVVRVSNSGDSTIFEDFAFFEAGQQGEVVMTCRSAGPSLMVFKENETYEIFGYSPDTFGIRLADSLFGAVGSRLAVSIAGTVFFWSTQGPRLTNGGPSDDIAVPLDIGGPDPAGLVDESDPQDAFVEYDPATRVVNFVWGKRVYALSIRDPNRPRWSYYELGETAQCGGLFFSTQSKAGSGGPPIGAPEDLIFPLAVAATQTCTFAAQPTDGPEFIYIDGIKYTFGTFVNASISNRVKIGATVSDTIDNFVHAINLTGVAGVNYSLGTVDIHPTVSAVAGAGDTMDITGKHGNTGFITVVDSELANYFGVPGTGVITWIGSALFPYFPSNGIQQGEFNVATMIGGSGPNAATQVDIEFTNVDLLGSEDIEVLVSTNDGANYTFAGVFPATGPSGGQQTITVLLENTNTGKKIQPLTDYKFSLRYRLGGLFSPGYGDPDPNNWDDPDFDSQGTTRTSAEEIGWILRSGGNQGFWEMINSEDQRMTLDPVVPGGHELIDIDVHLFGLGAAQFPDQAAIGGGIFGLGPAPGSNRFYETWNAAVAGYPTKYITNFLRTTGSGNEPGLESTNEFAMRFANGDNFGGLSVYLPVYGGPDPPISESLNSLNGQHPIHGSTQAGTITWNNAVSPPGRINPPTGPAGHTTMIFSFRPDATTPEWTQEQQQQPFLTANSNFALNGGFGNFVFGQDVLIGIQHITRHFEVSVRSAFCVIEENATGSQPNTRTFLYAGSLP
jgi:hypothetical protein